MTDAIPPQLNGSEIAIIGLAGRFPGAQTIEQFWHNLEHGVESVSFFSAEQLRAAGIDPALIDDPNYVRASAVLDEIELFDAAFFGFNPREASLLDPQQRIFLECMWEALERAGYDSERFDGAIGVYAGVGMNTYLLNNIQAQRDPRTPAEDFQTAIASDKDFLATRISYKLGLEGPSITVQTACSTSLVAVHLACQSLISGECDMALAGGVAVRVPHTAGFIYQEGGIASPDGHCRAFDKDARGTVFGNGAGVVVLRRLEDALDSGDTIYAVIKGSAINNDGALKVGYTAPREDGQARVIRAAQNIAEVAPETISYIEAHGTGTRLGDPIEIAALTQAFRRQTDRRGFCALGSLKTNIGHLDAAAGVAGLIKTALALQHRQIPPSLHYTAPNPQLELDSSPFYVNTTLQPWLAGDSPRRAGVSSFGIGGTNAHVILEEAPALEPSDPARPWQVLVLSARSASALETATDNLRDVLSAQPDLNLADVAYTLQLGRRGFEHRRALVCRDVADALAVLATRDPQRFLTNAQELTKRSVVFMFSGQGAQYVGMGQDLYADEPVFRATVERCCALLRPHLGLDLRTVLYPAPEQAAWATAELTQTALAQPALFVVAYALAQLWQSWGVQPAALIGHSLGEYVAATLAEVFTVEDALQLVAARGALMQAQPGGAMLSVALPAAELRPALDPQLDLAAINGPAQCVVSGPVPAIAALERQLTAQGVSTRQLVTSHAFHSRMMDDVAEPFTEQVRRVRLQAPQRPVVSNVTGTWLTAAEATDPAYWGRQLRATVQWAAGLATVGTVGPQVLLEVGPGQTLTTLARQQPWADGRAPLVLPTLRHPQRSEPDQAVVGRAMARLWLHGGMLDWPQLHAGTTRRRVPLPTYPFERQRFWIAPRPVAQPQVADVDHRRQALADWFAIPSWRRALPPEPIALDVQPSASSWLLFVDECGVGAGLAERLRAAGHRVSEVRLGAAFAAPGAQQYTVRPDQPADYATLMEALRAAEQLPTTIVHLWGVTPANAAPDLDQAIAHGLRSLLALAQALGDLDSTPRTLLVVSSQMQQVAAEPLVPEKALLLGPCKVIPQEYPQLTCRSIDLWLPAPGDTHGPDHAELLDLLVAEIMSAAPDPLVTYRGYDRWLPGFEPVQLAQARTAPPRLRERGVYLITGGLGGIGLELAEYLARTVAARLVLLGRGGLPERSTWSAYRAAHAFDDARSMQMRRIAALEALGAEVLVLSADVADRAQLTGALDAARTHFGALHGVIHAAGIPSGGLIQFKTADAVEQVLAAKVRGTVILHDLLRATPLDFLVLCSSLNAIIGGPGLVDYSAANAFLDAFARRHTSRRGPYVVAIDWDRWEQVGMAANTVSPFAGLRGPQPLTTRPVEHPLLQTVAPVSGSTTVYSAELSVARQWVLAEHRVVGRATLPGATYPDLARAAFAQQTGQTAVEIREMIFVTPLVVADDERRTMLTVLDQQGDEYRFRVVSRAETAAGGQWHEHVSARVRPLRAAPQLQHDLQAIIARCPEDQQAAMRYAAENAAARFVARGPRWHNLRRVFVGDRERLGCFELASTFAADLPSFQLHPALLDVATGFARPAEDEHYLPFAYERIAVHAGLPATIYSHVRYRDSQQPGQDVVTCDITLMDEQGLELVAIAGFALRRVGAAALDVLQGTTGAAQSSSPAASALAAEFDPLHVRLSVPADSSGAGILPHEGVDAFARILQRGGMAQVLVSTRPIAAVVAQAQLIARTALVASSDGQTLARPTHRRPDLASAYAPPSNEIEQTIAAVWQTMLGIDEIGIHDNFFELGGDSLIGIRVIAELKKRLQVDLPAVSLFEAPTISALTNYLQQQGGPVSFQHTQERADKKREVLERQRRLNKERRR